MDNEIVEFRGDSFGLNRWVAGSIIGHEQRTDGMWVNVLPVHSESENDSLLVREEDVRPLGAHAK
ncbi:MAG TPA: hypothetical protein VHX59_27550 [Mycobacteriales bacterium]|jgi:hypothetical protein|nr:hypothetical protein [Mycobacteriales bacterium]